jgi:hypothetical protein
VSSSIQRRKKSPTRKEKEDVAWKEWKRKEEADNKRKEEEDRIAREEAEKKAVTDVMKNKALADIWAIAAMKPKQTRKASPVREGSPRQRAASPGREERER